MDAKRFMQLKFLKRGILDRSINHRELRKLLSKKRWVLRLFEEELEDKERFVKLMEWFVKEGYLERLKGYKAEGDKTKYRFTKKGTKLITERITYKAIFKGKEQVLQRERMAFDFDENMRECLKSIYSKHKDKLFMDMRLRKAVEGELCFGMSLESPKTFNLFMIAMVEKGCIEKTPKGSRLTEKGIKLAGKRDTASDVSHYSKKELIDTVMEELYEEFGMSKFDKNEFMPVMEDVRKTLYFEESWRTRLGNPGKIGEWLLKNKYIVKSGVSAGGYAVKTTGSMLGIKTRRMQNWKINPDKWSPPEELVKKQKEKVFGK